MTPERIVLTGAALTIEDVHLVAHEYMHVEIDPKAWDRVVDCREFVLNYSEGPVYGMNTGLGGAKDKEIERETMAQYNREIILSHCTGILPEAPEQVVRAAMVVRLNTLLVGCTGVQPAVASLMAGLLNHRIHPIVPERGSVGAADITILSHIGLAMIGEGEVDYEGIRVPALEALTDAGLLPIVLGPKDALAIISSNAWAAGLAANTLYDLKNLMRAAHSVVCLSLEGFYGNISPLGESVNKIRGFLGQQKVAGIMREMLEGSYLHNPRENPTIQDPLSFRCAAHIHGAVEDAIETAEKALKIQLNSSDDNPCVLMHENAIVSTGNFDSLAYILPFQALAIALAHISRASCHRITKLCTPSFSGLTAFLAPTHTKNIMGYGILEISATALDAEVRHLANPVSTDFISCSIGMEDVANNGPFIIRNIAKIVDNLYRILAIEFLAAAQAVDLRTSEKGEKKELGRGTSTLYKSLRNRVPFLNDARNLSIEAQKVYELLKGKGEYSNLCTRDE